MGYLTCRASKSEYEGLGISISRIVLHKRYFAIVFVFTVLLFTVLGTSVVSLSTGMIHSQAAGICGRTEAVQVAILTEVQKTRAAATCSDVTDSELGAITRLVVNDATELRAGDFRGFANLSDLEFAGDSLSVLLADTFVGLSGLDRLTINDNKLTTVHSGALNGLTSVTNIHLHGDSIRAIPRDLFDGLDSLSRLLLHGDRISSLPIGVFSGLDRLRVLDIHTQDVKSVTNGVLSHLPNLRALHLRNENTEVLETGVFRGLPRLELLILEGSGIRQLGSGAFAGLSNLRRLHLNGNEIESIPAGLFSGLGNLTLLHLHGNSLKTIPADSFANQGKLQQLYMHGNDIATLPAGIFSGLDTVRDLHLHGNQMTALPDDIFADMVNLEELFLHENQLTDISSLKIAHLKNLEWFHAESNKLTALPDDLFTSPSCSLKAVGVGDNPFDGVPTTMIAAAKYDLLDVLPASSRPGCTDAAGVTDLYIHDIPLTSGDLAKLRDNFGDMERLVIGNTGIDGDAVLDLVSNMRFTALQGLGVDSNDLSSWNSEDAEPIASAFQRFEDFEALDMAETGINGDVALTILESVSPEFSRFSFSDNDLSSWSDPQLADRLAAAFSRLPNSRWTVVLLENAMINSDAADAIVPSLARKFGESAEVNLDLSGNQLTRIDADWFADWEFLSDLDLSDNQLTAIDPRVFAPMSDHLVSLDLSGNPLDPIPAREEFENVLPNLEDLVLPVPEEVEEPEMVEASVQTRLPYTGGGVPTVHLVMLLLLVGIATAMTGAALPMIYRRSRFH